MTGGEKKRRPRGYSTRPGSGEGKGSGVMTERGGIAEDSNRTVHSLRVKVGGVKRRRRTGAKDLL